MNRGTLKRRFPPPPSHPEALCQNPPRTTTTGSHHLHARPKSGGFLIAANIRQSSGIRENVRPASVQSLIAGTPPPPQGAQPMPSHCPP